MGEVMKTRILIPLVASAIACTVIGRGFIANHPEDFEAGSTSVRASASEAFDSGFTPRRLGLPSGAERANARAVALQASQVEVPIARGLATHIQRPALPQGPAAILQTAPRQDEVPRVKP